jgi:hypothetical protein
MTIEMERLAIEKDAQTMPWKYISPLLKLMIISGAIATLAFALFGFGLFT